MGIRPVPAPLFASYDDLGGQPGFFRAGRRFVTGSNWFQGRYAPPPVPARTAPTLMNVCEALVQTCALYCTYSAPVSPGA
jgi:hypothetical protein